MGRVHRWARWASAAPRLVNWINRVPGSSALGKRLAGIAPQRDVPRFADRTFTSWFRSRDTRPGGSRRVLLWPDTFNNHFHPESAIAATRVLESFGCAVSIPRRRLCCGRPLYDFGMLDEAREMLRDIMSVLKDEIDAGTPIVGLEPACVSVFKDELPNLFPGDETARKLAGQVVYFSDWLRAIDPPAVDAVGLRALVHGHCHHKAVIGMAGEMDLLGRLGVDAKLVESGCCGMAGSIGFRPETYALSVKAAEMDLLPAVRAASDDEAIVASGYSCREQIDQLSPRRALHVAEVAARALGLAADD
jgi:Fe-S oxidoreductase